MHPILSATLGAAALAGVLGLAACGKPSDASADNFTTAMNSYLAQRGDLCVGKNEWPIDVTEREIRTNARNAVQMPVLEKLGLASMSVAEIDVKDEDGESHHMKVRRYALTEDGQKSFVKRDVAQRDGSRVSKGDLCAAKLSLDKVVQWNAPSLPQAAQAAQAGAPMPAAGEKQMVVTYTYKAEPAQWMKDPEAQKVFPVVANVVRGAGSAQLTETFKLTDAGWVAVDL